MSGATMMLCVSDSASNVTKMHRLLPIDNLDVITFGCSGLASVLMTLSHLEDHFSQAVQNLSYCNNLEDTAQANYNVYT